MLRLIKYICIIIIQIILVSCQSFIENEIREIIQPVKLTAGISDTLIIRDMYYAENYDIEFLSNEFISIEYYEKEGKVVFTPSMEIEGMTLLEFRYGEEEYQFPVNVKKKTFHTFKLKPDENYDQLTLFGSFNSWNRQQYPMTDDNADGTLEVKVPLEPGTYQYKFFGDGKEFIDPDNDVKVPNGLGDFNSILVVPSRFTDNTFLHVIDYSESDNSAVFTFQYEQRDHPEKLTYNNLIPLLNNKKLDDDNVEIVGNRIILTFNSDELQGKQTIRLTVNQNGQNTNTQTIFLEDGKFAGADTNFSWYDAIIYSLMIDRFNDGDRSINNPVIHDSLSMKANYMGGDLQGIVDKLNEGYFDSLGINVLWISPVYDNPNEAYKEYPAPHRYYSGYHGYWPIDPEGVEEKFGDMDKLKEVISTAHDHDIKVLLDYVSNHVHKRHPYFKNHRDWFGQLELPDGRLNLRFWDEYRLTTWFEPYLPSFDYINSEEALE
ncbi:alpha-amylase family glycosyl hydrolase, partial [Bacteroidota bacterium]